MNSNKYSQNVVNLSAKVLTNKDVEVAIRTTWTVDDCVVINRQTEQGKPELVAYIVPSGLFAPEQLLSHLQTILPRELMPTVFVPISTIPLTDAI
jgi:acyl-coenzyme A synthetase/AMP-(fatty) acid ligase